MNAADYRDNSIINYFSDMTDVSWTKRERSHSLRTTLTDQKAEQVYKLLQDRGIDADLIKQKRNMSIVHVPRQSLDRLIALRNTLGNMAPIDMAPLLKAVKMKSLDIPDQNRAVSALREIANHKKMTVQELAKRSDLAELEKLIKVVRDKCGVPEVRTRNLFSRTIFGSNIEDDCAAALKKIDEAKSKCQENARKIFVEMDTTPPHNDAILSLIQEGVEVNQLNESGHTLLALATHNGNFELVEALISAKADVNQVSQHGWTPLRLATDQGNEKIVRALVDAGADVNQKFLDETPLHFELGLENPNPAILKALIEAKGADLNEPVVGTAPLHRAISKGNAEAVRMLIDAGADVNKVDADSMTPLYHALSKGNREVMNLLISAGADVTKGILQGYSPLHLAVHKGSLVDVYTLLNAGADVNQAIKEMDGLTPLHIAARQNRAQMVQALVTEGADANKENEKGLTPLHIACRYEHLDAVQALIWAGADVNHADREGKTPLHDVLQLDYADSEQMLRTFIDTRHTSDFLRLLKAEGTKDLPNTTTLFLTLYQQAKERNLNIAQLIQEFIQVDLVSVVNRLLHKAESNHLAEELLEVLMKAKLQKQWTSPEPGWSVLLQEHLEERLSSSGQPFLISSGAFEGDLLIHAKRGNGIESMPISKRDFYALWTRKEGDLERIKDAMLDQDHWLPPGQGEYQLRLTREELTTHPESILSRICEQFKNEVQSRLWVKFIGEAGIDEGGLRRQLIGQLFTEMRDKLKFQKCENELFKPRLQENEAGEFQPLSPEQKTAYRQLGQLMMFCLNAFEEYPSGMVFDQSVFKALTKMEEEGDFDDLTIEQAFNQVFHLYKEMNRSNENDAEKIERMKSYLEVVPESPDHLLREAAAFVMGDGNIEQLALNDDLEMIKQHLPEIKTAIRKVIFENYMRPVLEPINEIWAGMKEAPFNWILSFQDVQKMNPLALSRRLQGSASKEDVLKMLQFSNTPDDIRTWLKDWIKNADDQKLQLFLFALSGSGSLGSSAKIHIVNGESICFHTCFNTIDLDYNRIKSEQDFQERMEVALEIIKNNPRFDIG
ncbi:MAG: ankyrin repeat domain-containing protein [Parachlamydia sp.]|nr:ankyrin repeat domain-containing protein [Parachlamydia sp.]